MSATLKIKDVTSFLESIAPRSYQESYDNAGLITGDPSWNAGKILVTLDCTEDVVLEAIASGCNLIVAHHPIVFKGLKKLTGRGYVERAVILAIKHDVAIYAIHTNLDNVHAGVNRKICDRLSLGNLKILAPKSNTLSKLVTFVPEESSGTVLAALFAAGAGQIGQYKNCSFIMAGTGSFTPDESANPHIGVPLQEQRVAEMRVEVIFPNHLQEQLLTALRGVHPYEEVAYYVTAITNDNQEVGAGMVGDLAVPQEPLAFLQGLKESMNVQVIRHTRLLNNKITKVAVCGGSGSFLLTRAIQAGAQAFVSADFKYHEFFDADGQILIADIGHYESEAFTKDLLVDVLMKKFPTFAIIFSRIVTNPISYI